MSAAGGGFSGLELGSKTTFLCTNYNLNRGKGLSNGVGSSVEQWADRHN